MVGRIASVVLAIAVALVMPILVAVVGWYITSVDYFNRVPQAWSK